MPEDTTATSAPTGYAEDLRTKDGAVMRIAYGTAGGLTRPSADTLSQSHTGTEVGVIDETDINGVLTSFLGRPGVLG